MNKQPAEIIGKITSLVEKLLVGNFADGISDWTVVDDRRLTAETAFNMAIQTVVARVQLTTNEPETNMSAHLMAVWFNLQSIGRRLHATCNLIILYIYMYV